LNVLTYPNRGIRGGKFMERKKLKNPERAAAGIPLEDQYYRATDLYSGTTIVVHNHTFKLLEADTFAAQFLLENEGEYKDALTEKVIQHAKNAASQGKKTAIVGALNGNFSPDDFGAALAGAGLQLNEEDVSVIIDLFQGQDGLVDGSSLLAFIYEQ
jgi:hypothetical protein